MTKLLRLLLVVLITVLPHSGVAGLAMAAGGPEACPSDQNMHHQPGAAEAGYIGDYLSASLSCDCAAQPIVAGGPTLLVDGPQGTVIEIAGLDRTLSRSSFDDTVPPDLRPDHQKLYLRTLRLRC